MNAQANSFAIAKIRRERLAAGVSQTELAFHAKIVRARLNMAEKGWVTLRNDEILKLEQTLADLVQRKRVQQDSAAGSGDALATA